MALTVRMRVIIPPADDGPLLHKEPQVFPIRALGSFILVNIAVGSAVVVAALVADYPPMTGLLITLGAICSLNWSLKVARSAYRG